jgi:hypothetical protein
MTSKQTPDTQADTEEILLALPWSLIVVLGAIALVRPILSILGISTGLPWVSILATLGIMAIWIGVIVLRRVPHPFVTLVFVGGMYAVLAMVLNVAIQGNFSKLPAIGIVGILVTNLIWGAISGLIAVGIRRLQT